MLNKNGKSEHHCLVPDLKENTFSFTLLSIMLVVGCHIWSLLYWGILPLYPLCWEVTFVFCFWFFLPFFGHTHSTCKFLGQGLKLHHSSNPSCCSDNAGSLTHYTTRELLPRVCFFFLNHKCMLNFVKYFFSICWDDMMIWMIWISLRLRYLWDMKLTISLIYG